MQEATEERFAIIGFIFLLSAIVGVAEFFELYQFYNDCNKALDNLCGTGNFTTIIIRILIFGVGGLKLLGMGSGDNIQRTAELFEYKDKSKREHKETSSTESVEDAEGNQSIVQERRRRCRHWFPDNKRCDNYQAAGFCEEHIKL